MKRLIRYFKYAPTWIFFLTLVLISIFRNGIALYGERLRQYQNGDENWVLEISIAQDPLRRLLETLGITFGPYVFLCIYSGLFACGAYLISIEIQFYSQIQKRLFWISISLLPAVTIILGRFGTFDLISLILAALSALTRLRKRQYFYLLCLTLAHAESALIIALMLSLFGSIKKIRPLFFNVFGVTRPYYFMFCISFSLTLINTLRGPSRASELIPLIKISIAQAVSSGYWLIYSWFGGTILLFALVSNKFTKKELALFLSLFFSLGLASIFTADGTRVSALTLTLPLVAVLKYMLDSDLINSKALFLAYLLPAINVSNMNVFLPFRQIAYLFGLDLSYINSNVG